ncbi:PLASMODESMATA CALLOSE-BINDING PROTEIN 3-like, partial [Olea europaea subsp. europaea]
LSDAIYQKNIDYACGAGADCAPIMENGPCFQPNTRKDHCDFAVNSYYQRNRQIEGSCSFSNTVTLAQDPPPAISECVYPSMPRAMDSPNQQPFIHIYVSITITFAAGLIGIPLIVICLYKLFRKYWTRKIHLNEEESHEEATEIELTIVTSPSTILESEV